MFTVFAHAYANRGDLWSWACTDLLLSSPQGRGLHLLEIFNKVVETLVNNNNNSPSQDSTNLDYLHLPT